MIKYPKLCRMFIVHSYGIETKLGRGVKEGPERARVIFDHHGEEMKKKGFYSTLKYIGLGIEIRLYTWMDVRST